MQRSKAYCNFGLVVFYARGHALERCKLRESWLECPQDGTKPWLTGWSSPVVLALRLPRDQMKKAKAIGGSLPPVDV